MLYVCTMNPGRYKQIAASWTAHYPGLATVPGYQLDGGRLGALPLDAEIGSADMLAHFTASAEKIAREIPADAPAGIVSLDIETGQPFWPAVKSGAWPSAWVPRLAACRHFCAWLLRDRPPMRWASYGWPTRMGDPRHVETYRAASDALLPLLAEFDVLTPLLYDREPGEIIRDTNAVFLTMAEAVRVSQALEAIDGKRRGIAPQLWIRHRTGQYMDRREFARLLDGVCAFRETGRLDGITLWSNALHEGEAGQDAAAMIDRGYADEIAARVAP